MQRRFRGEEKEKRTGLVFFPAFDWAISPTHPEREERLLYTKDQIFEEGLVDLPQVVEYKAGVASKKDIARVHFCVPDIRSQITDAHLIAVGGALVLADAFMRGEVNNAFALVRPPGHHAMRVVHGNRGFCNINNEAIMIEYLRQHYGLRRIAIVDTDVHHGDGTQEIFYHDPDVLFISFHQDGRTLYPGSGFISEFGGPGAIGSTVNIPLPPGTTDAGIHYVLDELVLPILKEFNPELVVNSAGQDNHFTDPLANMAWTANGYARLNEKLKPDLAVLEGGYAVETALPYVNTAIILAMAGLDYSWVKEPELYSHRRSSGDSVSSQVKKVVDDLQGLWASRKDLGEKMREKVGPMYYQEKRIYYDTDNISEEQQVWVKLCPRCPGYLKIKSRAFPGYGGHGQIFGVSISQYACDPCREEGAGAYQEMKASPHQVDYVYLQDKSTDTYLRYEVDRKWEEKY
ncbi:MAG: histone deacetylase [Syntrophomonadaceae bacterium]|nr:histone deacetylase [Syntrophomonadaceae bacterium]